MKIIENNLAEWQIRQDIFHRLNINHDDDLKTKDIVIVEGDAIVYNAIDYFHKRDIGWIYPSKSYMVAICYARWLAKHFGNDPIFYLDEDNLLYGNDPYFKAYSRDPKTYHRILNEIGWDFDESLGMVPDVYEYFIAEFMLND
jgi:hypothetical protein